MSKLFSLVFNTFSDEEDREENTLTKRRKTEISAEYIRIKASKTEV